MLAEVRRRGAELVDLCASLVRIPSENPPGDTRAIADAVERYLAARGIPVARHEPKRGMPNLVARLGQGRPNLVLASHLDEFPAGGGWTFPPFSGEVRDGRIHGRGAGDMRAGIAVALFVAGLLAELAVEPRGSLTLAFASDEETGGRWGTEWLLEHVPEVRGDACLIGESSGTWSIGVGEKGVLWLRVRAAGVSGHAAYAQGDSAIAKVLAVLDVIQGLHGRPGRVPRDVARVIRAQRGPAEAHWGPGTGRLAGRLAVSVGSLRGGGQVNLIPAACEAEVDLRLPPGMTVAGVEAAIRRRARAWWGRGVELEVLNRCDPYVTSPDEPLVRHLIASAGGRRRPAPIPVVRLGYTDGRFFRRAGIPTAVHGPSVHGMGGPDEWISADELLAVAETHAGAVCDYLGGERGRG